MIELTLRRVLPPAACALAALLLVAAPPLRAEAARLCDSGSTLSLVGVDTAARTALWTVGDGTAASPAWLLALDLASGAASARRLGGPRLAGSISGGPVATAVACGADCLQVETWDGAAWQRAGEPLRVATSMTVDLTRDGSGALWAVLHRLSGPGEATAWGYRLEGGEWVAKGSLAIAALGTPGAQPSPLHDDGVVTGTGELRASGEPAPWVRGLPRVPPARHGQLVPIGGDAAAYLAGDGELYLSGDLGSTWKQSLWTPWESGTVQVRRRGSDYSVDLPIGDRSGALRLAWFDVRGEEVQHVILTEAPPSALTAPPRKLVEAPAAIATAKGESLPVTDVVRFADGSWLLFSGCVATGGGGSGLAWRTVDAGGAISAPRLAGLAVTAPAAVPSAAGSATTPPPPAP